MDVVVVGQGYVGLPLALTAASAGHRVTGVDLDPHRVAQLNAGESHIPDVPDADLLQALQSGGYQARSDYGAVVTADVVVVCVPTPLLHETPDLSHVEAAARSIAPRLRRGALVVLESTTYPGTTEEVLRPLLEHGSGLHAGVDFDLVFSPERIDPGNAKYGLRNTPKIVGGLTAQASDRARDFYGSFVERVVVVDGPRTAEMAKLLENTFRHVNIALVNELAVLCRELDIDVWQVIEAASTKPFGYMPFWPGPGVGGHCISVDSMYLAWRVKQTGRAAKFIDLARDVNAGMPHHVVQRVQDLLNDHARSVRGSRVLVLGVSYKADVGDMRESPAVPLIAQLLAKGADVVYHDDHVPQLSVCGRDLRQVELAPGLADADCVVVVTAHTGVDYFQVAENARLVFDTRACVPRAPHVHRL